MSIHQKDIILLQSETHSTGGVCGVGGFEVKSQKKNANRKIKKLLRARGTRAEAVEENVRQAAAFQERAPMPPRTEPRS